MEDKRSSLRTTELSARPGTLWPFRLWGLLGKARGQCIIVIGIPGGSRKLAIVLPPLRNGPSFCVLCRRLPHERPKEPMAPMWKVIAHALKIDEAGPMGLYLGCIHEKGDAIMDDG